MADIPIDNDLDLLGAARAKNALPGVAPGDYVTKAQLDAVGGLSIGKALAVAQNLPLY